MALRETPEEYYHSLLNTQPYTAQAVYPVQPAPAPLPDTLDNKGFWALVIIGAIGVIGILGILAAGVSK